MGRDLLVLESLDHIGQSIIDAVHIRVVDLIWISGQHDLGSISSPSDDCFHFVRCQVLGLVDNQELVGDE